MAKIAAELEYALVRRETAGAPGRTNATLLAQGPGWSVADVICTSGPADRSFEERHSRVSIAIVLAGTFQYHSEAGRELMTPGSLLLGNPGQSFECGHQHGHGDRCLSFSFEPDYFHPDFRILRIPPVRELSRFVAAASTGLTGIRPINWEELGIQLASQVQTLVTGKVSNQSSSDIARVTRTARRIAHDYTGQLSLRSLARDAALSPYHFLRTFQRVTGVTPHQFILRTRLQAAAVRLTADSAKILDIALDCGFGDISNFNRAFRTEFGVSPRAYRRKTSDTSVIQ